MNRSILLYLGIALITFGLIGGLKIVIIILGGMSLIASLFIYSTRKARVRYWLQNYKHLRNRAGLSNEFALLKLKEQFCKSKHSTQDVCSKTFTEIDAFVVQVIQAEFKFDILLKGDDAVWGLKRFMILKRKLNKEIDDVMQELGL